MDNLQTELPIQTKIKQRTRPNGQLLKWIGNKYKYANDIVAFLPKDFNQYIEPFIGTGAILATLSPAKGIAGDTLTPLIDMWNTLKTSPEVLINHYEETINRFNEDRKGVYAEVVDRYNANPNPEDLVIISRTCYGGVMRFRTDGHISTPIGPHKPIAPISFKARALEHHSRIQNTIFLNESFSETMKHANNGDVVYCDPPYIDSQKILYGAQKFDFKDLIDEIAKCKSRGVKIALSIDGAKKSGKKKIEIEVPPDLFEREVLLDCGSSMLKRFQNGGAAMIGEDVHDRLLLTW